MNSTFHLLTDGAPFRVTSLATGALISEFEPNPPGGDPANSTVEIAGPAGTSFSATLLTIESDAGSPGTIDRLSEISGTFDANGLLVVDVPDFENPSFTLVLAEGTSLSTADDIDADDDGTVDDLSVFGTVLDAISVSDTAGEPVYANQLGGTDFAFSGDEPELMFRDASTGALFAVNDITDDTTVFDETGASVDAAAFDMDPTASTFGAINPSAGGDPVPVLISEFQPNPPGGDPASATVEISGTAGEAFSGVLLTLEGDGSDVGTVDRLANILGTFDTNGLLVVDVPDFENPTFTLVLAESTTATLGEDLDADDDGTIDDPSVFGTVLDAIGIADTDGDVLYGADLGGTDFAFTGDEPEIIFRDASVGDLYAVNEIGAAPTTFDTAGNAVAEGDFDTDPSTATTFGAINSSLGTPPATTLSVSAPADAAEGDAGTTTFAFTVARTGDTSGETTVDFAVGGDVDADDFGGTFPASGTVTFAAGETTQTIDLAITGDEDTEADEALTVTLSNAVGASIGTASDTALVLNDDIGAIAAPYSFDFEIPFADEGWQAVSVDTDSANTWFDDSFSGDNFAEVNGFGDDAPANDWLISPLIDFSSLANPVASFQNTKNFEDEGLDNPELSFLFSSDYAGTGDPTGATWTELTYNFSSGGFNEVPSGEIDLSGLGATEGTFAFQYEASGTGGGSSSLWQIDDFAVSDSVPAQMVGIHDIQGSTNLADGTLVGVAGAADVSPLLGEKVRFDGIVTQVLPGLGGFYLQEPDEDADDDPFSSEGIFIQGMSDFGGADPTTEFVGLTIEGTVVEVEGETQVIADTIIFDGLRIPTDIPITAAEITFPTATVLQDADGDFVANLEAYEGMLVEIPEAMSVTELFQLDRFGTIRVSSEGRLDQFTQDNAPSQAGFTQHLKDIAARSLIIDDGSDAQNPSSILVPDLGADGTLDGGDVFRMGDEYTGLTGVLSYAEDDQTGSEEPEYRLHIPDGTLTQTNPRDEEPDDVGGSFQVASLNVLNFFTTLDEFPDQGEGSGPNGLSPRGADANPQDADPTPEPTEEYERQLNKLVETIVGLDADVLGLVELENDFETGGAAPTGSGTVVGSGVAIEELVGAVNAELGADIYDWVRPGSEFTGTDAIAVGFIYDTTTTSLVGDAAVLDDPSFTDPNSTGLQRNRPAVAQTFEEIASGETFTAAVNHFKSKGASGLSAGDPGNPDSDQRDGAGFWNDTRAAAAEALANWLATDPTGSGDPDTMILGDLNAYAMEDPIRALIDAGYTDLAAAFIADPYSFVFDGQRGTLDYALANGSLADQVTGATEWHTNADEPDAFDYNLEFGRDPSLSTLDPFRASDHDPVLVGLDLESDAEPVFQEVSLFVVGNVRSFRLVYYEDDARTAVPQGDFGRLVLSDEIDIDISALDSPDEFVIADDVLATTNGFGVRDGEDRATSVNGRIIEGDETIVFAIGEDAAFDFATSAVVKLTDISRGDVTLTGLLDGEVVASVTGDRRTLRLDDLDGPIDELQVSAADDQARFTVDAVKFFDVFEDFLVV